MSGLSRAQQLPFTGLFNRDDHYEDYGFAVIAEVGGVDLYLWEAVYIIKGGPGRPTSQWLGDGVIDNTMVVLAPAGWRGAGMHDNNYVRSGMSTPQYYRHDDLSVVHDDEAVTWTLDKMRYTYRFDTRTHRVAGEHAGVEYDLEFVQLPETSVVPLFGSDDEARLAGMAGVYSYSRVDGTLRVGGRTFEIENGQGLHEHIAFSQAPRWDVAAVGPQRDEKGGSVFGSFRTEELVFQIHRETPDETVAVVVAGGKDRYYHGDHVTLQAVESWVDPKSGVSIPCAWRLDCSSPEGTLAMDIRGYARGGWPWEVKRAILLQTAILSTASGTFVDTSGRVTRLEQAVGIMDYMRIVVRHNETLAGADTTPTW